MGLESASEPDEMDIDLDEPEEDGEGEQFFDTRSRSASTSTSSGGRDLGRGKSDEIDTEEDPVDPITPGPGMRTFDIGRTGGGEEGAYTGEDRAKGAREDEFDGAVFEDDIEDDWVDPSLPTPVAQPRTPQPRSSPPGPVDIPALAKGKLAIKKGKKGKKSPVVGAVPMVKTPTPIASQSQQHYPFPVTQKSADDTPLQERPHNVSGVVGKRMHTTRARDGGRTQSGGVKGVLPTDDC
jgi:cysteine protease ATG4